MKRPPIVGFGHMHLPARDLDGQRRFYTDIFGLSVLVDEVDFLLLGYEGGNLSFARVLRPPTETVSVHFGFRVRTPQDLDRWSAWLKGSGVELVAGPEDFTSERLQGRSIVCRDPEGYAVELSYEEET